MKKLLLLLLLALLFTSCGMTQQERLHKIKECKETGFRYTLDEFGNIVCRHRIINKEKWCIEQYVETINQKYNNPDVISNLKDDNFSTIIETCHKIYGNIN